MNSNCKIKGECPCECEVPEKQLDARSCDLNCYPPLMKEDEWNQFKLNNYKPIIMQDSNVPKIPYDGKPEVNKLYLYVPTNTIVKVIAMDKPIFGAPFFGSTVWFLPQNTRNSYPFSLPSKLLPFYLENVQIELPKSN